MGNGAQIRKLQPSTENTGVSIHPACVVGYFLTNEMHRVLGSDYPTMLSKFRNGTNQWANDLSGGNDISSTST